MNIEFHYYVTYILAAKAGFGPAEAWIIAYASQYVDDNDRKYVIEKGKDSEYKNYISQTMNILKPKTVHLRIYPCFHFVPGDTACQLARRSDRRVHPLNTTPNSENANILMDSALETKNLYRIGIATHCYADTWAHQNFVGCNDRFNEIFGLLEALIPNIGHADAMYNPDITSLIWEDKRLLKANRKIYNKQRILDAAEKIFIKYSRYTDKKSKRRHTNDKWRDIREELSKAIGPDRQRTARISQRRINSYKELVGDISPYQWRIWFDEGIETQVQTRYVRSAGIRQTVRRKKYFRKSNFTNCHWYRFQQAVREHQKFAIDLLKPRFQQIRFTDIANF